jgi:DNA polymerase I-like protein with 3'-5' exonuclease and polymerase domains
MLRQQGCRIVNFIHDEILLEVPENGDLQMVADEVQRIMIEEMRRVVPDVKIKVKLGYRRRWGSAEADEVRLS